jgi:hypothetical protein
VRSVKLFIVAFYYLCLSFVLFPFCVYLLLIYYFFLIIYFCSLSFFTISKEVIST